MRSLLAVLAVVFLLGPSSSRAEEEEDVPWSARPAVRIGTHVLGRAEVGRRLVAVLGRGIARSVLANAQLRHALEAKDLTVPEEEVEAGRRRLLESLEERGQTLESLMARLGLTEQALRRNVWNEAAGRILAKKVGISLTEIGSYLALNFPVVLAEEVDDPGFARVGEESIPVRALVEEVLPLVSAADRDRFLDGVLNAEVQDTAIKQARRPGPAEVDRLVNLERARLAANPAGSADLESVLRARGQTMEAFRDALALREQVRRAILADLKPDDEAIREHLERWRPYFEGRLVRVTHVFVAVEPPGGEQEWEAARKKADAVREEAMAGKPLGDLALLRSDDPRTRMRQGDFGYVPRKASGLDEAFAAAAFSLEEGEISEPVRTARGYHVIQVTGVHEGRPVDLEEDRDRIRGDWADSRRLQWLAKLRTGVEVEVLWDELKVNLTPPEPADDGER
jgi:parvulin-like peptidyl-prolyl isomerase